MIESVTLGDRVVVTGAAGFIASHLVDALLARGHEVIALDRRCFRNDELAAANLARAVECERFRPHKVDLAVADLESLMSGVDTVFHLAAVPGVRGSWGSRFGDYVTSNVVATQRVLTACEQAGVRRLVFASSSSVYGTASRPSREGDPTGPVSPYGVTKLAAEHLCLAHCRATAESSDRGRTAVLHRLWTSATSGHGDQPGAPGRADGN